MSLLDEIKEKSKAQFRPANRAGIEQLQSIGVPEDALAFYRDSEPVRIAEIGKVRLRSITDIVAENRDYVPGAYAQPCGYVVFATTLYGDAFCFDTRAASATNVPVVLIAHDLEPENGEMKREDLAKLAKPIAASFEEFLRAFASGTLDIDPLYPGDIS
jgi:hypothetical protein